MAKTHGSVRMGPMSILVLVVVLSLAVMTVLTASTANATYASAARQATFATDTYENEATAQLFIASLDETLLAARWGTAANVATAGANASATADATASATGSATDSATVNGAPSPSAAQGSSLTATSAASVVNDALSSIMGRCADEHPDCTVEASVTGTTLSATFTSAHGRSLNAVIEIRDGGIYSIEQWKTSAEWSTETNDTLWTGNVEETNTQGEAR